MYVVLIVHVMLYYVVNVILYQIALHQGGDGGDRKKILIMH